MLAIIAIVAGAVLGGLAADEGFGALFGALIGWLLWRSVRQQREIGELRRALVPPPAAAPAESPAAREEAAATAPEPEPAATPEPAAEVALPEPAPAAAAALPPARPGPLEPLRQWLLGGNTIVKAGIAILFVGLAFLAKYASEHVQLPVELRLAAVGGAAIVLLGFGWRLRLRRPGYAQALQGGAVAVLYLTLFVAFRGYGVLAVGPVFVLMVAVAALAAALAVLQDARSLAFIGAAGGFATPLLVSTGSGNVVALFGYYLVLDLGIAAVAWLRTWRALNLLGFVATFVVATAWGVLRYRPEDYAVGQGFLIAFFLLFVAILLMPARQGPRSGDRWVNGSLLFGLPTVAFVLQYGLVRDTEYGTALAALVAAGFYLLLAAALRGRERFALVFEGSLAVGVVFLTLVIPFAFDARSTGGAWALEGAGLVWLGLRQSRRVARGFGYALLLLAGTALLWAHDRSGLPVEWLGAPLFNGVLLALAALAAAFFVQRHVPAAERPEQAGERVAEPLLVGWATLWWIVTVQTHVRALVGPEDRIAATLALASAVSLLHVAIARRWQWRGAAWPLLGFAPLLGVLLGASALGQESPLDHGGAWAWPLALAAHLASLRWAAPLWPRGGAHLAHALGALCLAGWGALLGKATTADWGDAASAWPWLGWLLVPALLLLLLPRAATARLWPVREMTPAYQRSAAAVLALALLAWTLIANLASSGAARPLPHLPLLNPLDIGIGVALAAAASWWRSAPARQAFGARAALGPALLGGAGFVWLNAIVVRGFHHYGEVPLRFSAWVDSLAVQTGLTLLWTAVALALMWVAARRAWRAPWMAGAALLAAVVIKLLSVDLSGTGTVTRIVSFIGVGLLMLVIGYVAPLPAAPEKAHAKA